MITATRHPGSAARRARPPFPRAVDRARTSARTDGSTAATPASAPSDARRAGTEIGLLVAFVATTTVMVVGVVVLALLSTSWVLVPVVAAHWFATWIILARISGLLSQ